MIGITADLDYCPQQVLDFFSDIVHDYGYKVTFFMTHKLSVRSEHELALHPFFTDFKRIESVLDHLRDMFPKSIGIRTHRLRTADDWFLLYEKKGIQYDSSFLLTNRTILPYYLYGVRSGGLLEIPIYFSDDLHLWFPRRFPPVTTRRMLNVADRNRQSYVFAWHPIHVFLNTSTLAHYCKAKQFTREIDKLERYRNSGKGVRTLFVSFLESLRQKDANPLTLSQINGKVRKMLSNDERSALRPRRRHP
jgi:hypothetical protein